MSKNDLQDRIMSMTQDIEFVYNGKQGSVCPFNEFDISVSFDGKEMDYTDINDVMQDPFWDGKSLNQIADELMFD